LTSEDHLHAIQTTGLTKHYGAIQALDSLTIEVREGEIFGFLGPNGAGKSTTIRLLLGFLHPTSGQGRVLGLDIVKDSVAIRGRIGYLPSGIALYDTLTGREQLDYLARLNGRAPVRRAALCDRLELSAATLDRRVRDYSRGMRQKIGIVQALQHEPDLAILDEPTEGLDPLMQRAFYDLLDERRNAGRAIFFSSHILSEVERVCDRVAIVRRGRLVALENITNLLEHRKRNVELRVAGGDPPVLDGVPGVSAIGGTQDGRITCQLEGDVGPFLAAIAGHRISDLTIEPAHLEEAFLELYEDEDTNGVPTTAVTAPAAPAATGDGAGDTVATR
jgi:beta-exotoxin I transport system ATP-binding protein